MRRFAVSLLFAVSFLQSLSADGPAPKSAKEGLQPFNDLIGSWKCTGEPIGSREEVQKGFWTETLSVEWQFKGADAWLKLDFDKGKNFTKGELHYRPATNDYEMKLRTPKNETLVFAGQLTKGPPPKLILERQEGDAIQRLHFSLLHANRFLYNYSTRAADKSLFTGRWKVGATKEGESFATGDGGPECIVSGGKGTIAV